MQSQFDLNKFSVNLILKLQSIDLKIELNIAVFCSILDIFNFKYQKRDYSELNLVSFLYFI